MVEVTYVCECCGNGFVSKVSRPGEKLCNNCVEIRRYLRPFIERGGLSVGQVLARAGKLLLFYAEGK